MQQPVDLLARLAEMPPGAELAVGLAGLHLPGVPNDRIVDVLQAQARQLAHEQARLLATMVEVSRSTPFSDADDPQAQRLYGPRRAMARGVCRDPATLRPPAPGSSADFR